MVKIEVSPAGLRVLASTCGEQAATVAGIGSAPMSHSTFQSTAAAVRVVDTAVAVAGEQISSRLTSTGVLVSDAAVGYGVADDENAGQIDAVRQGLSEV